MNAVLDSIKKSADSKNITVHNKAADLLLLAAKAPGTHLPKVVKYAALGLEQSNPYVAHCSASVLSEAAKHRGKHLDGVLKKAFNTVVKKRYMDLKLDARIRAKCAEALANIASFGDKRAGTAILALVDYAESLGSLDERNLEQKRRVDNGYSIVQEGFNKLGNKKIGEIVEKFSPKDKRRFENLKKTLAEWKKRIPPESLI